MKTIEAIQQRQVFGETLRKLGHENEDIIVLDADVGTTTKVSLFEKDFPDRFFQAGIAEANMVSMAAGFSTTGRIPVTSAFSYFLTNRVIDQIRSICYANLNVKFVGTHGGVSPTVDGASHHALTDLAHMRCLPGMTLLCPADPRETEEAVEFMINHKGPVYLRLSRNECIPLLSEGKFEVGKGRVIQEGSDVTLVSTGVMLERTIKAARLLEDSGLSIGIAHMGSLKPFDSALIKDIASHCGGIVSVEEHSVIGGLGSAVAESMEDANNCTLRRVGFQDTYTRSGGYDELLDLYGLHPDSIADAARSIAG